MGNNATEVENILSHTKMIARGFWSSPPVHGKLKIKNYKILL